MQRTATKAPRNTKQAIVSTATSTEPKPSERSSLPSTISLIRREFRFGSDVRDICKVLPEVIESPIKE